MRIADYHRVSMDEKTDTKYFEVFHNSLSVLYPTIQYMLGIPENEKYVL